MSNPHPNKQTVDQSVQEATRKISEQTSRTTRDMAEMGEHTARTNVELLQSGMETARHLWQSSTDLSSSLATRTAEQLGRSLGLAGDETGAITERSSQNLAAIMQSTQSLNEGLCKVSDEWFKFVRVRMERTFEHAEKALRSRSPQELAAVQTEAFRDHLEGLVQSTQRIAQVSQQTADEASRKLSEAATRRAA
jgi:Phasin protein